ncbi:TerC family protein [Apilactobacillus apisilvae]|uniref:TerC family protein n=1 Tax=Apilactobacillus apisilvae TaxID=2923364 RepID=A0ABY4PK58_9LACO|nr:TerC family protein [Apilactobacillus apisilvae]UQS85741.1 TerC family protein [Apilactobacillus apisilvae]
MNVITSEDAWIVILSLVLIECLLSVDNAVVLAAQTQVLPNKKEQEESLFYGIWGSYVFRFLIIGLGTFLIHLWEIKIIGGLYLFYLAYKHFFGREKPKKNLANKAKPGSRKQFWMTVAQIEFMDIVFSVDSVLAALAISSNPVVVLIGGLIGILCMRGIAEVIMLVMKKIPELKSMAYFLIAVIALKLVLSIPAIDIEIPPLQFGLIVLATFAITIIIHFVRRKK